MLNNGSLAPLAIFLVGTALFGGLAPTAASAQTSGVVFGTPGAVTCCGESQSTLHVGGGVEGLIGDAVGIGGEIGFLGPWAYFRDGLGVMSVNGSYHFLPHQPGRRARPFVTTGYSLFFRDEHVNLWNVGGGIDYWVKPRMAVRVELRDHIHAEDGATVHFWGPRIGVVFRGR